MIRDIPLKTREFTLYIADELVVLQEQIGYLELVITGQGKKNNEMAYDYLAKTAISIGDNETINPEAVKGLKAPDNEQLAVEAYILNYGEIFDFEYMCPSCNEPSEQGIDLVNLPFRYLDASVVKCPNPIVEILLPRAGIKAVIGMLDGHKESTLMSRMNTGSYDTNQSDFLCLQSLDGSEKFSYEDVVGLPLQDHKAIRKARKKLVCGYDTRIRVTCPYCAAKSSFGLLQHKDFLLPLA